MTPKPPSSSDNPDLPPRHRPALGNLAQDTTEHDLWAFDDDIDSPDDSQESQEEGAQGSKGREIPAPRDGQGGERREGGEGAASKLPAPGEERIRMDVSKARLKVRSHGAVSGPSKPESDFDELENWEDVPLARDIGELPSDDLPVIMETPISEEVPVESAIATAPEAKSGPAETPHPAGNGDEDEFSPARPENATPISLRPHLGLTKIERIGLVSLLALLLIGGMTAYVYSLKRLPSESVKAKITDFPIKGDQISIQSANSFWRAPVTDGPNPDKFRLGTELLPVLEMNLSGGPAVLRVHFRNEDHSFVGDAVTYAVKEGGKVQIPATAGFDDPGMHAAYRTGQSKPWTIEVFEASSGDVSGSDFKKLFEMNISTDRR